MIETIIEPRRRDLGGFEVARILPHARRRMVGPFIFLDEMGPVDLPSGIPRSVDVRPHPHIGLSTVTYLFAGEIMHRDSVGSEQPIRPGEVNWMTAGRGITHSERFERARAQGDHVHGIQSWVALPTADEECDPAFTHYGAGELPLFEEPGIWARVIAGEALGATSPVTTHSPLFYVHVRMEPGARIDLPSRYPERAAFVVTGEVEVSGERHPAGRMLVFAADGSITLSAVHATTLMLLGGYPVGERHIEWNFVSSSKARIDQAKADWKAGRMKLPDNDHDEFIPLPGEPQAPANPMS